MLIIGLMSLLSMTACSPLRFFQSTASKPQYVYVVSSNDSGSKGSVSAYRIDGTTGALTLVTGSPFAAGKYAASIAINRAGTFAYVANPGDGTTSAYRIHATTGALTPLPDSQPGSGAEDNGERHAIAINPAGTFAYMASALDNTIRAYTIDTATGDLGVVDGSQYATTDVPISVTVNPAGTFVYAVNGPDLGAGRETGTVSVFRINAVTGALTPVGRPVAAGHFPVSVVINPAGTFAYVTGNNFLVYRINATTGVLTPVSSGVQFNVRIEAGGCGGIAINPAGTFAYVLPNPIFVGAGIEAGTVSVLRINAVTGALTPVGRPVAAGKFPNSIAINSAGTFAYVVDNDGYDISVYRIHASTGALTPVPGSPFTFGAKPDFITIVQPQ